MLVRRAEPDLGDLVVRLQHRGAHGVERLLQGPAVRGGELLDQRLPDRGVAGVPVDVGRGVPPAGHQGGGHDAVVGLLQRGVRVLEEALELAAGGLQHGQVLQAGQHPATLLTAAAGHGDHCGAGDVAAAHEGVVVTLGSDRSPVPRVLLDPHLGRRGLRGGVEEVAGQGQRVVLDRLDAVFLRVRERRVLLRVGGQHVGLVAIGVGRPEVAAQGGGDVQVVDLVPVGVAVDPHHTVLGLAVLVRSEGDAHG